MPTASPQSPQFSFVEEIDRLDLTFTEESQYDLGQLSVDKRVQVRTSHEEGTFAPREEVERYAIQMGHSAFPPVIVTADGWIVDGNTRVGARLKRGEKFSPAILLTESWDGASEKRQHELHALGATLNCQNGRTLSRDERRANVEHLLALGWTAENIERVLGIKPNTTRDIARELDAEKRIAKVGASPNGGPKVRGAALRALGRSVPLSINDQPYKELVTLAADADFKAAEVKGLADLVKEAGSDAAALNLLADQRVEHGERIKHTKLTGAGRPPQSAQLRQALGRIFSAESDPGSYVERNPDMADEHVARLRRGVAVLEAVIAAQEA